MSKEKQIEEMVTELAEAHHEMDVAWTNYFIDKEKFPKPKPEHTILAEHLYNAGYRKQREGEWLQGVNNSKVCSVCGKEPLYTASGTAFATTFYRVKSNFCPNCGAKMRKEDEGK